MDPIILTIVIVVAVLVLIGGLVVGTRNRSTDDDTGSTPRPTSLTATDEGGTGSGGGTATIAPPEPDDSTPYPGGPDLRVEDEPEVEEPPTLSPLQRFRQQLTKASSAFGSNLRNIFASGLDEDAWEELEDSLIAADVGVEATMELVEGLRERTKAEGITDGEGALRLLKEVLRLELGTADRSMARREEGTTVWLFTGVNGTGKTTSIGKLAKRQVDAGDKVVLAAADTFRAAASEQLEIWGERSGARVIRQDEGADPAAVAFDGWKAASAAGADLLMIDTAGRLQNKKELMAELSKVKRVVERESGHLDEVMLVLDATTGQNGLTQAKAFMEAVEITGVVLTKLDGTAKGGIVIAIQRALGIPVKLVGLGEGIEDLAEFDPDAFVDALFAEVIDGDGGLDGEDVDAELAEMLREAEQGDHGDDGARDEA